MIYLIVMVTSYILTPHMFMYFNKIITWLNYFVSNNTATIDSDVIIHTIFVLRTYIGQPHKGNLKCGSSNGTIC